MKQMKCSIARFGQRVVCIALLVLLLAPFAGLGVAAESHVAKVSSLSGKVSIERQGKTVTAEEGVRLFPGDRLETGTEGSVGVIFRDETTLSLGPQTNIAIQEYVFVPQESKFSFVIKMFKGTASYVSGLIAKLSPKSVKFITPSATIGVRGTKFVVEVDPL